MNRQQLLWSQLPRCEQFSLRSCVHIVTALSSQQFDFSIWDEWARTVSPNPGVKVYIGAPGSAKAAGQGYVNITLLQEYALDAQKNYSTFGGVMLWDASDAYGMS